MRRRRTGGVQKGRSGRVLGAAGDCGYSGRPVAEFLPGIPPAPFLEVRSVPLPGVPFVCLVGATPPPAVCSQPPPWSKGSHGACRWRRGPRPSRTLPPMEEIPLFMRATVSGSRRVRSPDWPPFRRAATKRPMSSAVECIRYPFPFQRGSSTFAPFFRVWGGTLRVPIGLLGKVPHPRPVGRPHAKSDRQIRVEGVS